MRASAFTTSPALRSPALPGKQRRSSARHDRGTAVMVLGQQQVQGQGAPRLVQRLQSAAVAVAAAAWLAGAAPAVAEIQTVPASEATQMAKPLQQQPVNKGRIWLLMVLGGAALFGSTVVLENNAAWFPAITKANRAMTDAKKRMAEPPAEEPAPPARQPIDIAVLYEQQEAERRRLAAVQAEREADASSQAAVLAGLQQAKQQVLAAGGSDGVEAAAAAGAVAATNAPAAAAAAETAGLEAQHEDVAQPAAAPPAAAGAWVAEDAAAAEDAAKYPPLIFEPGSLDKINNPDAPKVLQGMSDEQLEAALRQRQLEMQRQQQQ